MHLELRNITKRFGGFTANKNISLTVEPGQIHCLLGENGAGKSTLMNVLFGLLEPEEGEILIDGEPVTFTNSGDAVRRGIGMVHQHFMLVPVFSVAENVVLGFEPTKSFDRLDLDAWVDQYKQCSGRPGGKEQRSNKPWDANIQQDCLKEAKYGTSKNKSLDSAFEKVLARSLSRKRSSI